MISYIMNAVLITLLCGASFLGWNLNKRLKALRAGQEQFARAVADLDRAAIVAHNSLKELRADADDTQEILHGRILAARDLMGKMDAQIARAEKAEKDIENGLTTLAVLQSVKPAPVARAEPPAEPVPLGYNRAGKPAIAPQPEDDDDYNPAWSPAAKKAAAVARGVPVKPADHASQRRPFDRDLIRAEDDLPRPRPLRQGGSLLPKIEEADESDMLDKVQMSELVVANLNEMIRTMAMPKRQVLSVEDDLFGKVDQPSSPHAPSGGRPTSSQR